MTTIRTRPATNRQPAFELASRAEDGTVRRGLVLNPAQPKWEERQTPPLRFITLDIETCHPAAEDMDRLVVRKLLTNAKDEDDDKIDWTAYTVKQAKALLLKTWTPPKSVTKEETIRERHEEYRLSLDEIERSIREKSSLADVAPVAIIAVCDETGMIIFESMRPGGLVPKGRGRLDVRCGDERAMLVSFRDWLDARSVTYPFALSGFNIKHFDLPKLRDRYIRHSLRMPLALRVCDGEPVNPTIDLMEVYLRFCTSDFKNKPMISLSAVLDHLGWPNYKREVNGSQVPDLVNAGQFDLAGDYAATDVFVENRLREYLSSLGARLE